MDLKDIKPEISSDNEDFVLNDISGEESSAEHSEHSSEHHYSSHSHSHHGSGKHRHRSSSSSSKKKRRNSVKKMFSKIPASSKKSKKAGRKRSLVRLLKHKYQKLGSKDRKLVIAVLCFASVIVVALTAFLVFLAVHTHTYGEWIVVEEPTCSHAGLKERECFCGKKQGVPLTVPHMSEYSYLDTGTGMVISTCSVCSAVEKSLPVYKDIGLPVLNLTGDLADVSKNEYIKIYVSYSYDGGDFECMGNIKLQGSTSTGFEKTNYTLKLKDDLGNKYKTEMAEGWGAHSKYCLKANYCDASHLRNVVTAKLYGQAVHQGDRNDEYTALVNGGAIDGFPVAVYINGEFHGLYTLNIPKDEWIFNIKDADGDRKAVLFCENWSNAAFLDENLNYDVKSSGFEYTYCSTEDTTWATDSFNEMMNFLKTSDGAAFVSGVEKYINVDAAIDSMIVTYLANGRDNIAKNILWSTFDGVKWAP
ncbi:MAG: CotH kinase family protein, partial [Clostridia bacterium]|nr:CotH kinase family protein [Clostridia bacterium]